MKRLALVLGASLLAACASEPRLPIAPGVYRFQQRFAEHPSMPGAELKAVINDRRIELVDDGNSTVFPGGVVAEGMLLWHPRSRQWIIGQGESDRDADEVGGCSDGPEVVDLVAKTCWTC